MKSLALAGLFAVGAVVSASAATIQSKRADNGLNVVLVAGEIVQDDDLRFEQVVSPLSGPTVAVLEGPGGNLMAGLNIGLAIRRLGMATAVPADSFCASVCGDIWLAGSPRLLSQTSKVGFHAAYRPDGTESGEGNALVGAYLHQMGLSFRAIAYLTERPPSDVNWLHAGDAERLGIAYRLIQPPPPPAPFLSDTAQQGPPAPQTPSVAEQQAGRTVVSVYAIWSRGGPVEDLAGYYGDTVSFYGSPVPRAKVMEEQRKFALRWPIRHYSVNADTLFVHCDDSFCSVAGVVSWDCSSPERGARSTGMANFAVRLVDGRIVSQNGSVLSRTAETPAQQQAMQTAAYAEGRQARFDYERWFAALPDGQFKDGVVFWADHRSDKPTPPPCAGAEERQAGCEAARTRLTSVDQRRAADKNFWWGWNSL